MQVQECAGRVFNLAIVGPIQGRGAHIGPFLIGVLWEPAGVLRRHHDK